MREQRERARAKEREVEAAVATVGVGKARGVDGELLGGIATVRGRSNREKKRRHGVKKS